jgi:cobalt transporter subunit CbtA
MTRHLLTSAVLAGLAAGIAAAVLQFIFVLPLLLEGELFESAVRVHFAAGSAESQAGAPPVWGDFGRHAGTLAMNLLAYTGFGLLLVAGFALAGRAGHAVDARRGAIWGLAGFLAVGLAPAFGLPPELPGTVGAELGARQLWWAGCVGATGAGLALLAFGRGAVAPGIGVALIALPHLVGAPHLEAYYGVAPPELAAHFATRSLGVAALSWGVLGTVAGALWAQR